MTAAADSPRLVQKMVFRWMGSCIKSQMKLFDDDREKKRVRDQKTIIFASLVNRLGCSSRTKHDWTSTYPTANTNNHDNNSNRDYRLKLVHRAHLNNIIIICYY